LLGAFFGEGGQSRKKGKKLKLKKLIVFQITTFGCRRVRYIQGIKKIFA
jgi:hypothetical protein